MNGIILASIPLLFPTYILLQLLFLEESGSNPVQIIYTWIQQFFLSTFTLPGEDGDDSIKNTNDPPPSVESQLLAYVFVSVLGYVATDRLIPIIKMYTLRKGISGKDLGKRGTEFSSRDVPEALGVVPGSIFLICLTFCLVGYATSHPTKLLDCNSALLSICFMLFLGFTDDVLDWPWRYKLFLPTIASLPLLCCYEGSTSIVIPIQLRSTLMKDGLLTPLSKLLCYFVVVDANADGAIVNLGIWYLLYMSMLAVFCTNAINIYAGINGLEAGQSYVIGCAVLLHNLIEIQSDSQSKENHLFSVMIVLSFVGVTLALLKHNWYPASVFVGDTYCYFAGMVFAVVGILGHFSKTLLLFFIPQVINFIWSIPQLFKLVPCPRHRLPKFNAKTGLMEPSTFECKPHEYRWLKFLSNGNKNGTEVANMTVINLFLQIFGPMSEGNLCTALLVGQILCCSLGLFFRYNLAQVFFDE
mmetsp:Transcript_24020/g.27412  ORF Transcript_24020/g.27412 Transcript_24020/m.27412 type:complete len:471 (-) Transcript_24020:102-1514(-)